MNAGTVTPGAVAKFVRWQLDKWPMAAANFRALDDVEVKEIDVDGLTFKAQFNPARAVSSGAKVDAASIKARPCFLCEKNRPAEQGGIALGRYTLLINPFPLAPRHLVIADNSHVRQEIDGRVADMVGLANSLEGFTVFYNGPRCGASAPDHMHFQALPSDVMPLNSMITPDRLEELSTRHGARILASKGMPFNFFVIEGAFPPAFVTAFRALIEQFGAVPEDQWETPVNILVTKVAPGLTRMVVIPRGAHRPSFYGTEGEECMMLSPASVDMGGLFILPRRVDFDRIDDKIIRQTFKEVGVSDEKFSEICRRISDK